MNVHSTEKARSQVSEPSFEVPGGACDCHTHIFGPFDRFPLSADRHYTPPEASTEELQALHRALHVQRVVIVTPSPYEADNGCTLYAVQRLGPAARAVVVIGQHATKTQLQQMHSAGARGVRVNLAVRGICGIELSAQFVREAAERMAPLGWHLQLFARLDVIAALAPMIRTLPVPVVLDHFGFPDSNSSSHAHTFESVLNLVSSGNAYVKLSAPHRIGDPDSEVVASMARALIAANPSRMLWGTDWPHCGGRPRDPDRRFDVEPFQSIDDGLALSRLSTWANDDALTRRILVENPSSLYDFDSVPEGNAD